MYRIDGSSDLKEDVLDHWRGLPRVGAGADRQRRRRAAAARHLRRGAGQHLRRRPGRPASSRTRGGRRSAGVLDWLADNWDQPEEGIWETRGGRQSFTYGRVMCWVAFDRGIRMAVEHGLPAPLERWTAERDRIYQQVMDQGFHATPAGVRPALRHRRPGLRAAADADGRVHRRHATRCGCRPSTAMDDELVTDSLVYRYDPEASPDGLRGSEGTFSLCTFAYVDALTRAGRLDDARTAFEKMLTYANHVGPVLRGDRPDRRADRQLPAGVHAPGADRRRDHPRRRPGPGARLTRRAATDEDSRRGPP